MATSLNLTEHMTTDYSSVQKQHNGQGSIQSVMTKDRIKAGQQK